MEYKEYLKKLKGCFVGKAVGGTLGMPMEGYIGTKNITYYDPIPTEMVANDDLDLQVVWLEVIQRHGLPINRKDLADGWLEHMKALPDEYGVVIRNLKTGLYPPLSGWYDNKFHSGMGSAIRTELWAGLAPKNPALAVQLSREDACADHYGDGVDATAFLAAIESAAYGECEREKLIAIGMEYITPNGRLQRMFLDTIQWWKQCKNPFAVREQILQKYFVQNWTDVGINLSYILIGWMDGDEETDIPKKLSRAICTAASLGHDGDCTTATLGAILGTIYPNQLEERWTAPLGEELVLSSCISAMHEVRTISEFCEQVAMVCASVQDFYHSPSRLVEYDFSCTVPVWAKKDTFLAIPMEYDAQESLVAIQPLIVKVRYPEKVALAPQETVPFTAKISNPKQMICNTNLKLHVPYGWTVVPDTFCLELSGEKEETIAFAITAPAMRNRRVARNNLDFQFVTDTLDFTVSAGLIETFNFLRVKTDWVSADCPTDEIFQDAEVVSVPTHFQPVPEGAYLYAIEMRPHTRIAEAILLAQGTRPIRVWYDGKLILEHDGTEYTPAFHRSENCRVLTLTGEWKRFVILVGSNLPQTMGCKKNNTPKNSLAPVEGCPSPYTIREKYDTKALQMGEDGEFFFGIANRTSNEWIYELEWRIPQWERIKN